MIKKLTNRINYEEITMFKDHFICIAKKRKGRK